MKPADLLSCAPSLVVPGVKVGSWEKGMGRRNDLFVTGTSTSWTKKGNAPKWTQARAGADITSHEVSRVQGDGACVAFNCTEVF